MKHHCAATPVAAFFFLSGLALAAPTARASARIGLDPLKLSLPGRALAASVAVTNEGKKPVTFQVELLAWSQANDRDVLVPTKDLIVAPPVFQIPADGKQTVRVGRLARVAPGPVEKTYRLAITEIPPETQAPGLPNGVATALRVTIPVVVPPADPQPPTYTWTATPRDGTAMVLAVTNNGNTSFGVTHLTLSRDGNILASQAVSIPVLPGATRKLGWTDLPPGIVGPGLEVETELSNHLKNSQPLVLGSPADTPPPALVTPSSVPPVVSVPTTRLR